MFCQRTDHVSSVLLAIQGGQTRSRSERGSWNASATRNATIGGCLYHCVILPICTWIFILLTVTSALSFYLINILCGFNQKKMKFNNKQTSYEATMNEASWFSFLFSSASKSLPRYIVEACRNKWKISIKGYQSGAQGQESTVLIALHRWRWTSRERRDGNNVGLILLHVDRTFA